MVRVSAHRGPLARVAVPLALVSALSTVLLAAGCGAATSGRAGLPTGSVTPGTCKLKTTAEEVVALSDTSPAVPCSTPHTLQAYALGRLDPAVAALGPDRPVSEILTARDGDVCPLTVRDFLGAEPLDSQWGLSVFAKYPTRAEWRGGERTVVCDLVVSAPTGVVPALSVSLEGALRHDDSARFRLCSRGADLLTCDQPHTAERAGDVPVGDPSGEEAACTANGLAYTRSAAPQGWRPTVVHRDGAAQCWLTALDGQRTGTLRGGLVAR